MTEAQTKTTRRDLVEQGLGALDPQRAGAVSVSTAAGGVTFSDAMQVMEFAKLMAVSGEAVPPHLQGNAGMCLAVTFRSIGWRMDPFAVAEKSYVVNHRLAWESQLVHAVIEARAPLQHRLDCTYDGKVEDGTRVCIVVGEFSNGDVREYRSPMLKDIRVKNSPLWVGDPDQQLWYYASRSWARKWCPEVLLGIYTREELIENPRLGAREDDPLADVEPGLHRRLVGSGAADTGEGFKPGHAHSELSQVAAGAINGEVLPPEGSTGDAAPAGKAGGKRSKATDKKKAAAPGPAPDAEEPEAGPPRTAKAYIAYATAWVAKATDPDDIEARWDAEREQRDDLGVPIGSRKNFENDILKQRVAALRGG